MDRTTTMVAIPAMVEARKPRTRKPKRGWAWIPVEVAVPHLSSDARVETADPTAWCSGLAARDGVVAGACAAGRHWRTPLTALPRARRAATHEPSLGPTVFVGDVEDGSRKPIPVMSSSYPSVTRWRADGVPAGYDDDLASASERLSMSHKVTRGAQAAFVRDMAAEDRARYAQYAHRPVRPFALDPSVRWTVLEPGFLDRCRDVAAATLAMVDGVVMEAAPPPSRLVVHDNEFVRGSPLVVVDGYADVVASVRPSSDKPVVQTVLPFGVPWAEDAVRHATRRGGPYDGNPVDTTLLARSSGSVATPGPGFEVVDPGMARLLMTTRAARIVLDEDVPLAVTHVSSEGVAAREALSEAYAAVVRYAGRSGAFEHRDSLLMRGVAFAAEVRERHAPPGPTFAPAAPAALDDLAAFAP